MRRKYGAMSKAGLADSSTVAARLAEFCVLDGLSPRAVRQVARMGSWLCLPGGMELMREGHHDRALFFILSGTIGVQVEDGRGALECVAHVPAGETVGEMSLLSDEPHSARLIAHRDCEIFVLGRDAFERIIAHHPQLLRNLSLLLVKRLRRTTSRSLHHPRCRAIALLGDSGRDEVKELAHKLLPVLIGMGLKVAYLDEREQGRPAEWYQHVETSHDILLYVATDGDKMWRRQAERQADRVLLVGGKDGAAAPAAHQADRKPADRIFLIDDMAETPAEAAQHTGNLRHFLRRGVQRDIHRLARHLAGRAIGLVLSGGGARGFSHVGVYRALHEAGIPVDAVGGTSMGAIIAAGIAYEWSPNELMARMKEAFVATNPMSDFTVPKVSFFSGRKVRRLLSHHFGKSRIEDLTLPYFCVTADLTDGVDCAHRHGMVAERLAASVALPGLLPPLVIDNHIHVDGGIMNNLPVDHMSRLISGPIIAVDVCGNTSLASEGGSVPGILSILARTGTVGNEWQRREARRQASLLIEPMMAAVGFRDWQNFDRAVAIGYETARAKITAEPERLLLDKPEDSLALAANG